MMGGATVSLAPFVQSTPLDLKGLILELTNSNGGSDNLDTFKYYGFIDEHLPYSFENQILVFYDEDDQVINTAMYSSEDEYYFDVFYGDFQDFSGEIINDGDWWYDFELSYSGDNSGTWYAEKGGYYTYEDYYYEYEDGYGWWDWNYVWKPYVTKTGKFYHYPKNWDINQNSIPDSSELEFSNGSTLANTNLAYPQTLNESYIDTANIPPLEPISSIKGMIIVEELQLKSIRRYKNQNKNNYFPETLVYDRRQEVTSIGEDYSLIVPTGYFISSNRVLYPEDSTANSYTLYYDNQNEPITYNDFYNGAYDLGGFYTEKIGPVSDSDDGMARITNTKYAYSNGLLQIGTKIKTDGVIIIHMYTTILM